MKSFLRQATPERSFWLFSLLAAVAIAGGTPALPAATRGPPVTNQISMHVAQIRSAVQPLIMTLNHLVSESVIIGAQLALGDDAGIQLRKNFGVNSPGSRAGVSYDTLFLIGSCSKPVVATCVLAFAEKSKLNLNQPIGRWLPRYEQLKLADGGPAARAPTVRELMAHRAGIFARDETRTPRQRRLLTDFTQTLPQLVDAIADEPLAGEPGGQFAYSNAGYCVLGRVAELASGRDLESLLYEQLGRHLGWRRTTYFPSPQDRDVAQGGSGKDPRQPDLLLPHAMNSQPRLVCVGGCLYSTATEIGQFARMMLRRGQGPRSTVLSEATWTTILQPAYAGQDYGLGWYLVRSQEGKTSMLYHGGIFASARSLIQIHLDRNIFVVLHYTVAAASPDAGPKAIPEAVQQMLSLLDRMEEAR